MLNPRVTHHDRRNGGLRVDHAPIQTTNCTGHANPPYNVGIPRYSITSFASAEICVGIVTPSARAVLRLMANCGGACSIGNSPAFAPLRIRSTKEAARR